MEVKNGVVRLTGTASTGARCLEAAVLARSIQGVRAVEDDVRLANSEALRQRGTERTTKRSDRPRAVASVNERRTAMGGRNERAKTESEVQEEKPKTAESVFRSEPKGKPIYFSCAGRPRDLKKSEITLYNVKHS